MLYLIIFLYTLNMSGKPTGLSKGEKRRFARIVQSVGIVRVFYLVFWGKSFHKHSWVCPRNVHTVVQKKQYRLLCYYVETHPDVFKDDTDFLHNIGMMMVTRLKSAKSRELCCSIEQYDECLAEIRGKFCSWCPESKPAFMK